MPRATLRDCPDETLDGSLVFLRVDFNVPLEGGTIADDTRLRSALPTLQYLKERGGRVVMASHLGRPGGHPEPEFSLEPVARYLRGELGVPVTFCPETTGPRATQAVESLESGAFLLLENTRFQAEETANDGAWAAELAHGAELYVNDAFGTAHRAHASTEGVARVVRERGGRAVAGLLLERELRCLGRLLADPERPFVAILGGAKISGKIDVIEALLPRVDRLLVGGAMANTFFLAMGLEVGQSLVEKDRVEMARELMERAGERLMLPVDVVAGDRIAESAATRPSPRSEVGAGETIGDIGPDTARLYAEEIGTAGTVLWNGPMGVFEIDAYAQGTNAVAQAAATAADGGCEVVLGGGDSAAAAAHAGVTDRLTHVSTGGGASLELLAGKSLPGVDALSQKED